MNILFEASFRSHNTRISEILIIKGADLNIRTEYGGMTAFLYAARECNYLYTLNMLARYGANVKEVSKFNTNAIQFASLKNSNPNILRYLIRLGFRIDVREDGKSLLMLAAISNSNPAILETLIEYGCNIFEYNRDWDCLFYTLQSNQNVEVVESILDQAYSCKFIKSSSLDINHSDHRKRIVNSTN